jgi:hypothetical protein
MLPRVVSKRMDYHHEAWNTISKTQLCLENFLKSLLCAVAEVGQHVCVVPEKNPEQGRDAEDVLPMGNWIQNVAAEVLSELDNPLCMTARTEPPTLAREGQQILVTTVRIRTPDAGKTHAEIAALKVFLNDLLNHTPEEPESLLKLRRVILLEAFMVLRQKLPKRRPTRIPRMINRSI